jgi:antitoxin component YwqK of YwqJK toxin-antitoxin module
MTECIFDVINEFSGNYALTGKGSETSDYAIIDKSGKMINGEFNFSVTDPDYNGVKETFNCKIIFKDGKLNGKFISSFSNGKKQCEVSFNSGSFVKHSLSIYNKDGSLLLNDAKDDYSNLSTSDKAQLRLIAESYYELFLKSFDEGEKYKVHMPGKPQQKDKSGKCPTF